ncbi:hypothetical protein STVIR_7716 [Streptomyces viridochromogenes Tue57]|uniref:Peptidase A2 domain-containing protein n=2 Tax=Streptomyces viridochromogenes TaxID=1938 RepID=L8P7P2_STRVR|nr:hypothetical protein STVIR_7716 [Streptomyces viridochromogenes Tue57]
MFALDTGASAGVIDEDVADQVGLARTGESRSVSGILGTGRVPVARVARVAQWTVGDVRLGPGEVTIIDLGLKKPGSQGPTPPGGRGTEP